MKNKYINEFIKSDLDHWAGDGDYACALWVRSDDSKWSKTEIYLDPYDAIEPLARLNNKVGLLEMFGKMTNVEDDTEKFRVRVLFTLNGHEMTVGVQKQGEDDLFMDTDEAEGAFVDFTNAVLSVMGVA